MATAYEPLMQPVTPNGRIEVLEGQSHLGIIGSEPASALIADYLQARTPSG